MSDISTASNNIDLDNPEFRTAMSLICNTNCSVFLTGKAGTGKSTFLRYITHNTPKKYILLAPTGIAAVNVGGQTLHSFFKLPFKPLLPDDPEFSSPSRMKARLKYRKSTVKIIKEVELIIIDEISMVRADIIDFIDRILRCYTGNNRQPFGGKQLLLVGDVFQLEPVVTSDMREILQRYYKAPYFFNAKVFAEITLVSVELTKVYRQKDLNFVSLLDRIRLGKPTEDDISLINSKVMAEPEKVYDESEMRMTIATRREMVDHINQSRLDALPASECVYMGEVSGDFPENTFPTDLELTLKDGAQVVFVKNDLGKRWVNGTIGKIINAGSDHIEVELENGQKHNVEVERWENIRYGYDEEAHKVIEEVVGSFSQYPIKLAWALTIHKSQGLTFSKVTIDVGRGAFTGGQSYVALSRCTSLDGIKLLSTINERDIFVSPVINRFSRQFNDKCIIDQAITSARADAFYSCAAQDFERGDIMHAAVAFCDAVSLRNDLQRPEVVRLISRKLSVVNRLKETIVQLREQIDQRDAQMHSVSDEYTEMGDSCRQNGWDISAALSNYNRALDFNPGNVNAMIGKALALFEVNDADAAIALLDKASHIDENDYRALFELGKFFFSCDDYSNALDCLLLSVERNDKVAAVHDALRQVYETIGDRRSARRHANAASRIRGKSSHN